MEQSNHTVAVISLGKKLVKELKLEESVNTLGRWMAHYLAELMSKIEIETSSIKKKKLEKECCDIILKIWANRRDMPRQARPLSNFTDVLSVLNGLKRNKKSITPWREFVHDDDQSAWGKFMKDISESYDQVVAISIFANYASEALKKEKEWLDHSELLSKEEKEIIEKLDYLLSHNNYSGIQIIYSNEQNTEPELDRIAQIVKKLSSLMQKQTESFKELKRQLTPKANNNENLDNDLN